MATITVLAIGIALLLAAEWARRRTHTSTDYFLAGRRLPPRLAALSQFANAGLIWAVLALPVHAYDHGGAAVWYAGALLLGYLLSWHYLAPRLQRLSVMQHVITPGQLISADFSRGTHRAVLVSLALVISCAVLMMTSARWGVAITALAPLPGQGSTMLLACGVAVALYLMLGGYWAASVVDALLAAAAVLVLLILALATLFAGGVAIPLPLRPMEWFSGHTWVVALSFAVGLVSAGLGEGGQPHALTRFMAMPDVAAIRRARGLVFAALVVATISALLIGWYARSLTDLGTRELWLQAVAERVLPYGGLSIATPLLAGYLALSVGSAWLAAVAGWIVDLRHQRAATATPLWLVRWLVLLFAAAALAVTGYLPADANAALQRWQLGWQLLGASIAPWLLVRLAGKRIRATATIGAIWAGFSLTLIFHVMPEAPGDYLERVLPFVAALGIVLTGGERRRDPERDEPRTDDGVNAKI